MDKDKIDVALASTDPLNLALKQIEEVLYLRVRYDMEAKL